MKWIKKFLVLVFAVFLLFVMGITAGIYFYGKDIKSYALNTAKEKLHKDIQVSETSFTGIRHIPNIGLKLTSFYCPGFTSSDTLLYAEDALVVFNLIDVLFGNLKIARVEMENASVRILKNKDGLTNYSLGNKSKSGKNSAFDLNDIRFLNTNLIYNDETNSTLIRSNLDNMQLGVTYSDAIYDLNLVGTLTLNQLIAGQDSWANERTELKTSIQLRINEAENSYHFTESKISIDKTPISIDGSIINLADFNQYQITFESEKLDLNTAKEYIPEKLLTKLSAYSLEGKAKVSCSLSGSDANGEGLLTEFCFTSAKSGITLKHNNNDILIKDISGCYSFKPNTNDELLAISNFEIEFEKEVISGNLTIRDFKNPFIQLKADGKINLSAINSLIPIETIELAEGRLNLDMSFEGDFKKAETYKSNGEIELKDINLAFKNHPLKLASLNGKFKLNDNNIDVKDFSANLNESDVLLNGNVTNLYNYLILGDEFLKIKANLSSNLLDLNSVWNSSNNKSDTTFVVNFGKGLDINLALNINEFYFQKFEARNAIGTVTLKDQVLHTDELALNAMDGSAIIKGRVDASSNQVKILTQSDVSKIDIHKLFYQVGNFGQDVVVYQNLKGLVTAKITFNSEWSKTLEADLNKVYAQSDFIIENGELNNFEPMLALSKYVKGTDLKHVAFSTLRNSIEIENKTIYFPSMEINSTALDIVASGKHTFNNDIDYNLQLLVSELLGKKVKTLNTEFGEIEDDGLGRSKLFLTMTGTVGEPKFALDKKGIANKIAQDIKNEKQELRQLLHTEFGKNKKDSISDIPAKNSNTSDFELGEEEDFEFIDD